MMTNTNNSNQGENEMGWKYRKIEGEELWVAYDSFNHGALAVIFESEGLASEYVSQRHVDAIWAAAK